MSRTLTLQTLIDKDACSSQVDLFRQTFGESVGVTETLAVEMAGLFDWDWSAVHLLTAPARAEYKRVRAAARAEHDRVTAPAWAEYDRVIAPAWAEYDRVTAPARAECDRVRAATWARLYNEETET